VGRVINRRLKGDTFLRVVYGALAGVGLILLVQAIRTRS
jgi:hypothetical protein